MYVSAQLERNVQLHPRYFGNRLHERITQQLASDVEGRRLLGSGGAENGIPDGLVVAIQRVDDIQDGELPVNGTGHAIFHVTFTAVMLTAWKHEIVEAHVDNVTRLGIVCVAGPVELFVSMYNLPDYLHFDNNAVPPCFCNAAGDVKIQKDSFIRLRIMGTLINSNCIKCTATIEGDYLGTISHLDLY